MRPDLPRYVEARLGEMPEAYFLDGAAVRALSRIADAAEAPPVAGRVSPQPLPAGASEGVLKTIAAIEAIEAIAVRVAMVEGGLTNLAPCDAELVRDVRQAFDAWRLGGGPQALMMRRAETLGVALPAQHGGKQCDFLG